MNSAQRRLEDLIDVVTVVDHFRGWNEHSDEDTLSYNHHENRQVNH